MKDMILGIAASILDSFLTEERMDIAKEKVIEYLREKAQESSNQLDDVLVDKLADFLEVK